MHTGRFADSVKKQLNRSAFDSPEARLLLQYLRGMILSGSPSLTAHLNDGSHRLFGAKLNPMTIPALLEILADAIERRNPCVIAYQNLHGMHLNFENEPLPALHCLSSTYVYIDSIPIYLLCKVFGIPVERRQRITGLDYIWPLLTLAQSNRWRVYYVGSRERVLNSARAEIARRTPDLAFRAHNGHFDMATDSAAIVDDINEFKADLVIVGMGMPRQEQWTLENAPRAHSASFILVGALMECVAGEVSTPPRWLGPIGFEWLFRLWTDPRRFWRRYLVEPWVLAGNIIRYCAGRR